MRERPVLIVGGAGALGQAFGAALARRGPVDVLVRPGRVDQLSAGVSVWRLRTGRAPLAQPFVPDRVLTAAEPGDYAFVLLAVASDALREPWLPELCATLAGVPIVSIGQASGDRDAVERAAGADRAVFVLPSVIAYAGPLRRELPLPGVAVWYPPLSRRLVGGARAQEVARELSACGIPAQASPAAGPVGVWIATQSIPFIAALETAGWSFAALRRDRQLRALAAQACVEAGRRRGPRAAAARAVLSVVGRLAPFDVEEYTRRHFTKVGPQTRMMLDEWIAAAGRRPAPALQALRERLG